MPRVAPITEKSEVATEYQDIVDAVLQVFGDIRGPHSILLHTPKAEAAVLPLSKFFRGDSVVQSPQRDLAAITVAREKDCVYIWAAQVNNARRASLAEDVISAVREHVDPSSLRPEEAVIVSYVQQLLRENRVEAATFDALNDRYGVPWLVELTVLVGFYGMLAGVVNAFEVPAPIDGDRLPA